MAARIGRQTPTTSFVLDYHQTKSPEAIELYEKSGQTVLEWQRLMLKDLMAVQSDGLWTHMMCGYSLPRRNGKTEVVYMRELWGLLNGEKIAHTAHRTSTSHSSWEKLVRLLTKAGYEDGVDFTSIRAKGSENIHFVETDGDIQYRTRTGSGGLGEGFDLLVIDEAQEYTDDQRSALSYTVTSSQNPQTIMCGTPPTNVSKGTVFPKFREGCLQGKEQDAYWAEWAVSVMSKVDDPELWYETNPSLGQIFTERNVRSEPSDDEVDFNIQRLGLWIGYNQSSAITEKDWNQLEVSELPDLTGPIHVGVKYGQDNRNVAMSIAVRTKDGKVFVESLDCRPVKSGNDWILDFLTQANTAQVVIDGANGQGILQKEMKDARLSKRPVLPTVKEIINANALFEQGVFQCQLCHAGQLSLRQSATNCDKRAIGSNGGFGYRSQADEIDISLLESVALAYWSCVSEKPKKKRTIRY